MTKNKSIKSKIVKIINNTISTKLSIDKNFNKNKIPQWDSLKNLEIIFKLEESFKITFSVKELDSLNTLENIVKIIIKKSDK